MVKSLSNLIKILETSTSTSKSECKMIIDLSLKDCNNSDKYKLLASMLEPKYTTQSNQESSTRALCTKIEYFKTNNHQGIFSSMSQPNVKPPTIIHTRYQSNESSSATIKIVYRIHSRNTDHFHKPHINNHYENNSIFPISMRIWYNHVISNSSIIIFY